MRNRKLKVPIHKKRVAMFPEKPSDRALGPCEDVGAWMAEGLNELLVRNARCDIRARRFPLRPWTKFAAGVDG